MIDRDISGNALLEELGRALRASLRQLVTAPDGSLPRPTSLARRWKLDQTLCVRVLSALRNQDALAVLHQLPATGSLRGLVEAAARHGLPASQISATRELIKRLEAVIRELGGKKSNLDTMIASLRGGEARSKIEHTSKQGIFRGMTNLIGTSSELALASFFVYPGDEPGRCHELAIYGGLGTRRLRPERTMLVGGRVLARASEVDVERAQAVLSGDRLDDSGYSVALQRYCSQPLPDVEVLHEGRKLLYTLPADSAGGFQKVSLLFASIDRNATPRVGSPAESRAPFLFVPRNPSKDLLMDIFVHRTVWPDIEPQLIMGRSDRLLTSTADTIPIDFFDFHEELEVLDADPETWRTPLFPEYAELIDTIHEDRGWVPGDFRQYRLHVKYPVIGISYLVAFDLL